MSRASANFRNAAVIALALGGSAGVGAGEGIVSFKSVEDTTTIDAKERTLWSLGGEADLAIARSGLAYGDAELDAYLQSIVDKLFPEFPGLIRVRALRSTQVNAFMQPNGSTYMFIGMLNFADNEAQLAAILAHEGAHFIDRHGYRGYKSAASVAVFGQLVALGGIPIAGELIAASSIMGYSRGLETSADEIGLVRLQRAGYDVREAKVPFERLVAYLKANDVDEPFFFASHPKLQQRVEFYAVNAEQLQARGGELNAAVYLQRTERARLAAVEEDARRRNFRTLIYLLQDDGRAALLPPQSRYYLGVAYKQRNRPGDVALAEAAFERTRAEAPDFAPTYKALGELRMRDPARAAEARELFTTYLQLAPEAADRNYVQSYLARLAPSGGQ